MANSAVAQWQKDIVMRSNFSVGMYPASVPVQDNPYIPTLVSAIKKKNIDVKNCNVLNPNINQAVLHVHWLERIFHTRLGSRSNLVAKLFSYNVLRAAERTRRAGGKVVWTAHNLYPHDNLNDGQRKVWDEFSRDFWALVSDVFTLSSTAESQIKQELPQVSNKQFHLVYHQNFVDFFKGFAEKRTFRTRHGIPDDAILFSLTGYLKPYKQVDNVIRHFLDANIKNAYLVVAGRCSESYLATLESSRRGMRTVVILPKSFSHGEMVDLVSSSDASVFNFRRIFNSGSVISSLSVGTPVILSRTPGMLELAEMSGSGSYHFYDGDLQPNVFHSAVEKFKNQEISPSNLSMFDPAIVAERHLRGYGLV